MENQTVVPEEDSLNNNPHIALIETFCEITTCPSKTEALFFLESHNFDLDAAVSTFLDDTNPTAVAAEDNLNSPLAHFNSHDQPSDESSSPSSHRSRSPSPPPALQSYNLRSSTKPKTSGGLRRGVHGRRRFDGGVRTLADLNRNPKDDSDSDTDFDPQEYYTGGEKSGMPVQDPTRRNDVNAIFDQVRRSGAVGGPAENLLPSSSRNFSGTGRLFSGEMSSTPQQPEVVNHNIVFWRNGFTIDAGPFRRLDDPENASFLESVKNGECPEELAPVDKLTEVHVNLSRREENYQEQEKPHLPFQGVGRTLGSTSDITSMELNRGHNASTTTALTPSSALVINETQPCTSIQLRLADGTRVVTRFNNCHTIRDIRGFIDASRTSIRRNYQLQTMGFPPKQLDDLDQTIDQAGIANSVVIQKL